jgi:hypothetical protein
MRHLLYLEPFLDALLFYVTFMCVYALTCRDVVMTLSKQNGFYRILSLLMHHICVAPNLLASVTVPLHFTGGKLVLH